MQTFLPYSSFKLSALMLDRQRLGKQRVEAKQVLQSMLDLDRFGDPGNTGQAFTNHPIHEQWRDYAPALLSYTRYICEEWVERGYQDNVIPWLDKAAQVRELPMLYQGDLREMGLLPWWLGEGKLHILHRANLLAKNFDWYSQRPEQCGLQPWVIPLVYRSGFGYSWPRQDRTWRTLRRAAR
jgi:hypothetical protein